MIRYKIWVHILQRALVKNQELAKKMTGFIVLSTIGVSKESQLRGATILQVPIDHRGKRGKLKRTGHSLTIASYNLMAKRWEQLKDAVNKSKLNKRR